MLPPASPLVATAAIAILGVDATKYTAEAKPELALRQIFHQCSLPEDVRLALAGAGVRTVDFMSNLGEDVAVVLANVVTLIGEDSLGTGPKKVVATTQITSVWRKSLLHVTNQESAKMRMCEDPTKIPEIAVAEHSEYKAAFIQNHPRHCSV